MTVLRKVKKSREGRLNGPVVKPKAITRRSKTKGEGIVIRCPVSRSEPEGRDYATVASDL